mmetsp:Transcript_11476/g.36359  ORF Transcript_11476/g.36359 Transcript_11476/m.36359 type:complete len:220 (+) Transcript_11476:766-1425(+)
MRGATISGVNRKPLVLCLPVSISLCRSSAPLVSSPLSISSRTVRSSKLARPAAPIRSMATPTFIASLRRKALPASTLTIVKVIARTHLSKRRACVGGRGVPISFSRAAAPTRAISAESFGSLDRCTTALWITSRVSTRGGVVSSKRSGESLASGFLPPAATWARGAFGGKSQRRTASDALPSFASALACAIASGSPLLTLTLLRGAYFGASSSSSSPSL